ncbi:protein kinase domain-containing protein [Citrus sinensis]|uniref:Protein kinase domain-containing protein n=1 Tax=Citrus sinensis TaxID=2711 RepID=A0ACB8KF56_CITSI|nr:protein kinase domain-containing protein [Citrus sinensis]
MAAELAVKDGRKLMWSQSVKMFIRGKGKIGYLTGSIKEPTEEDPKFHTWAADNSMIMSWLVNSMESEIGQTYLFLPTAKDLWDAVTETYSDLGNSAQIYDLKTRIRETKQGSQGVTKYYNILKGLWQELDQYYDGEWECAADSAKYKKMLEKERVFEFLAGLSSDLDEVRGRVLGKEPLPSTREVFSYVKREESRKNVMMGGSSAENSALISVTPEAPLIGGTKNLKKSDEKDRVWCDYCHKPRHTRDACWKLHGKPPNLKNNKFSGKHSRGFQVFGENQPTINTGESESQLFTKEQLEQLYKFLNQSQSLPNPSSSSSLAQKGNDFSALGVVYEKKDPWIIDSGATDHMTSHSKLFYSYIPCPGSQKIKIADGSLSSAAGKGSIPISTNLVLTSVLHVPNLSCNLLSVSKITKDLHCIAKFSPSYCEFQDLCSGKKIGSAREVDGLYYFEEDVSLCGEAQATNNELTFSIKDKIMLWHLRLESVLETTNDLDVPIALRKGTRSCTLHPISKYVSYHRLSPSFRAFAANLSVIAIPKSVQDALSIPEWRDAGYAEMRALEKSKTWELVKLPEGKKPVGCKWIFTVKYRADGSLERYKARLVAKGFTQTYSIDYQETFAPVAKMNSIRVLLSLAASLGWQLQQLDVKNAFLNGELEEEVYMDLPPGFENEYGIEKVCKLKRSLYGLKQSPRAWFDRFTKSVHSFGYLQSQADHTMFFKHFTDGSVVILIVYVDDIILTGSNVIEMENLKKVLAREFEMKDLGPLRYFLGMEIARSSKGIFVSQRKYTLDLLKETGMLGCKPGDTPIDPYHKLGYAIEGKSVDRESYQRLVGKLIYLSHTRPDIAFAVSVISQFMHSPCKEHLEAVYKVLKYLKKTPGKGLLFKKNNNMQVEVYTDADWAGSIIDRRSTSGYCTFVGGNLVTWRSKKQSVVARSSAEAEFRAVAYGICELLWLKKLLEELKIIIDVPMKLYCDNKAAINIAHNPIHHDRTKHVEVCCANFNVLASARIYCSID